MRDLVKHISWTYQQFDWIKTIIKQNIGEIYIHWVRIFISIYLFILMLLYSRWEHHSVFESLGFEHQELEKEKKGNQIICLKLDSF